MNCSCKNHYKTGRENAGLTQEEAAEMLGICVRALSNYETGKTVPSDKLVRKMMELYGAKLLGWWHLRNTSALANTYLPDIQPPQTDKDISLQIAFLEDDLVELKMLVHWFSLEETTKTKAMQFEKIKEVSKKIAEKVMSIFHYQPEAPI